MERTGVPMRTAADAVVPDWTAAEVVDAVRLAALLAEQLALRGEALRNLAQALEVACDALAPLAAAARPISGPALRSLVTIALMALGQAGEAVEELEVVATQTKRLIKEPRQ